mgnify:CR=1 FL=1
MDNILALIIIAAAAVYVGLRIKRNLSSKNSPSCGCGGCSCKKDNDCKE